MGGYNTAYDAWFHSTTNAMRANAPTDKVIVWLNRSGNVTPTGSYKEPGTLAGTQRDLNVGDAPSWNLYSFLRKETTTSAGLNMTDVTDCLMSKGYLSNHKYSSGVEFNAGIYNGSDAFHLLTRQVNVQ